MTNDWTAKMHHIRCIRLSFHWVWEFLPRYLLTKTASDQNSSPPKKLAAKSCIAQTGHPCAPVSLKASFWGFRFPAALRAHLRGASGRELRQELRASRGPDHEAHEAPETTRGKKEGPSRWDGRNAEMEPHGKETRSKGPTEMQIVLKMGGLLRSCLSFNTSVGNVQNSFERLQI